MPALGCLLLSLLGADAAPVPSGMVRVEGGEHPRPCMGSGSPGGTEPVADFDIDQREVSVEAYADCVRVGQCAPAGRGAQCNFEKPGKEQHPINCVTWAEAASFCAWRGKRLPRWVEWDRAAFGGAERRPFPWGEAEANCQRAVFRATTDLVANLKQGCGGLGGTQAVGARPAGASPQGVLGLSGNVSEWLFDWRPSEGAPRQERLHGGGSWSEGPASLEKVKSAPPGTRRSSIGFRCVQSSIY